jgi:glucosyl-dolichyl phosphate glucuronosyltransferase
MTGTRLTVAICTWNRSALLEQTLQRMTTLVTPPDLPWELLVVNNNSTDATDSVIARFASRLPIRGVVEQRPGLSNARNRAVNEAVGQYILFTDDDVLVDRDWLVEYDKAFRAYPDSAQFGGPVDPWFEGTPPEWLTQVFPVVAAAYAAVDHGPNPITLDDRHLVFGANIAANASVLRRYRFDPMLGRTGNNMVSGEETTLFSLMRRDGHTGRWVPGARVRHFIPRERQTLAYLRRWTVGIGRFQGMAPVKPGESSLFGIPLWVWRQFFEYIPRYCVDRVTRPPSKWIRDASYVASAWGYMRGRLSARQRSS